MLCFCSRQSADEKADLSLKQLHKVKVLESQEEEDAIHERSRKAQEAELQEAMLERARAKEAQAAAVRPPPPLPEMPSPQIERQSFRDTPDVDQVAAILGNSMSVGRIGSMNSVDGLG